MRTVIDLTEDDSAAEPGDLPSPSIFVHQRKGPTGVVVVSFRETELRMSFPQFVAFVEAAGSYLFRFRCHTRLEDSEFDMADDIGIPAEEHERLRDLAVAMLRGELGGVEVGEDLQCAIRRALAAPDAEAMAMWQSLDRRALELENENRALREEVAALKRRRRRDT